MGLEPDQSGKPWNPFLSMLPKQVNENVRERQKPVFLVALREKFLHSCGADVMPEEGSSHYLSLPRADTV